MKDGPGGRMTFRGVLKTYSTGGMAEGRSRDELLYLLSVHVRQYALQVVDDAL